ncbi:MAG: 2-C-methyl-D-erythritol 2,4-cyclodiphosphate synthase, partial [Clostridia bacterium]|nr:2-C-methyl-D-erythritol 2,4-cyclodiphosphate synthase [Clostridia bacterium]
DISSIYLLKQVLEMIRNEGYKVINVSAVIMAQKPKLSTYTQKLSTSLAEVIHIEPKKVGITCTTLEGVGLVGREEAIVCQAYCLLQKLS